MASIKGISKEQIIALIEILEIDRVTIEGDIDKLDASSPDGREYIVVPNGVYNISIRGHDPKP